MYKRTSQSYHFRTRTGNYSARPSVRGWHPDIVALASRARKISEEFNIAGLQHSLDDAAKSANQAQKKFSANNWRRKDDPIRLTALRAFHETRLSKSLISHRLKNARVLAEWLVFNAAYVSLVGDTKVSKGKNIRSTKKRLENLENKASFINQDFVKTSEQVAIKATNRRSEKIINGKLRDVYGDMKRIRGALSHKGKLYGFDGPVPLELHAMITERAHEISPDIFKERDMK